MSKTILVLVALSGALNLSYEMLWIRAYSFAIEGRAFGFSIVLGSYLIGLALGAALVPRLTKRYDSLDKRSLQAVAIFVGLGNISGYLVIPLLAWLATLMERSLSIPLIPILFAAMFLGTHLPLLMHYGIQPDVNAGKNIGIYYLANILGSVLGTFFTGWFLMDLLSISEISTVLLIGGGLLSVLIFVLADPRARSFFLSVSITFTILGVTLMMQGRLFDQLYERLLFWEDYQTEPKVEKLVENRSGVLIRLDNGVVIGGGVYDGELSVDLVNDKNMIIRPYSMSAFVDKPKSVLVVGVGSASWLRVLTNHPDIQRVVVVEINPGYVELLKGTAGEQILKNPKVTYYVDDVRRWLLNNPEESFDAIICNASFNWRTMSTSLASIEFFEIAKKHLNPKGIFLLNTTGSRRIFRTAFDVFGEVNRVENALIATPDKFDFSTERLRKILLQYKIDGEPIIRQDSPTDMTRLDSIVGDFTIPAMRKEGVQAAVWNDHETLKKSVLWEKIITDDNMGEEYNSSFFTP